MPAEKMLVLRGVERKDHERGEVFRTGELTPHTSQS